jgi:hypothetical protein
MATTFSNRHSRKLRFQPLEERAMMTGVVTAIVANGTLTLKGDAQPNEVRVVQNVGSDGKLLAGDFSVIGENLTSITTGGDNGYTSRRFQDVKNITVDLADGDDKLSFVPYSQPSKDTSLSLAGNLDIEMGGGKNKVELSGVKISGQTTISTGNSHDQVSASYSAFHDLRIDTHLGGDTVELYQTNVAMDLSIYMNVNASKDTVYDGGSDALEVVATTVGHNMVVRQDHSLQSSMRIGAIYAIGESSHVVVGNDLVIQTGSGTDVIQVLNTQVGHDLNVSTGAGNDHVDIKKTQIVDGLFAALGDGKDTLLVSDTNWGNRTSIDLGAGDDKLTMSNTDGFNANISGGTGAHDQLFVDDTVHIDPMWIIWSFEEHYSS